MGNDMMVYLNGECVANIGRVNHYRDPNRDTPTKDECKLRLTKAIMNYIAKGLQEDSMEVLDDVIERVFDDLRMLGREETLSKFEEYDDEHKFEFKESYEVDAMEEMATYETKDEKEDKQWLKQGAEQKGTQPEAPMGNEIVNECNYIREMLLEKNKAYGNSAMEPINIFSKATASDQIRVRIDDKLNRLLKGNEFIGDDTVLDLIGYLILLRISIAKGGS